MTDPVKTLDEMIRENIRDAGYAVAGGRDLFMELMDTSTGLVGFEAGRKVTVLSLPESDFIEMIDDERGDELLVLPDTAVLKQIELSQPWVVKLPTPSKTLLWFGASMRSFQGPVTLPEFVED